MQSGLGIGSLYGPDIDMLLWDSGMTEKSDGKAHAIFPTQGVLGPPGKVPFLIARGGELEKNCDADFGNLGSGHAGIPTQETVEAAQKLPFAAAYLPSKCSKELHQICRSNEYRGKCWIDRDDVTEPPNQKKEPGGRAGWHPGDRVHQLKGRVIAMMILQALEAALTTWNEAPEYILEDSVWHVTNYYQNIKAKVAAWENPKCMAFNEVTPGMGDILCRQGIKVSTIGLVRDLQILFQSGGLLQYPVLWVATL